jgi:hypothetical protein
MTVGLSDLATRHKGIIGGNEGNGDKEKDPQGKVSNCLKPGDLDLRSSHRIKFISTE